MSCLRNLYLFAHGGVQHMLRCLFALFFLVLCALCCQFLWVVYSWLLLLFSLTFIQGECVYFSNLHNWFRLFMWRINTWYEFTEYLPKKILSVPFIRFHLCKRKDIQLNVLKWSLHDSWTKSCLQIDLQLQYNGIFSYLLMWVEECYIIVYSILSLLTNVLSSWRQWFSITPLPGKKASFIQYNVTLFYSH
jgi:energy-coupling factor transporter transmembrane protein EcfT